MDIIIFSDIHNDVENLLTYYDKIKELIPKAGLIVACWGNLGTFKDRDRQIIIMTHLLERQLHHLGLTQTGCPKHAAYVEKGVKPILWNEIKKND